MQVRNETIDAALVCTLNMNDDKPHGPVSDILVSLHLSLSKQNGLKQKKTNEILQRC